MARESKVSEAMKAFDRGDKVAGSRKSEYTSKGEDVKGTKSAPYTNSKKSQMDRQEEGKVGKK